jgi:hypothetical protein
MNYKGCLNLQKRVSRVNDGQDFILFPSDNMKGWADVRSAGYAADNYTKQSKSYVPLSAVSTYHTSRPWSKQETSRTWHDMGCASREGNYVTSWLKHATLQNEPE